MKKQIVALTLVALGYAASTYSGGTLVLVYVTNPEKNMIVGGEQGIKARSLDIMKEHRKGRGPVVELEQFEKGRWIIIAKNEGKVWLDMEKYKHGRSDNHPKGHHRCKPLIITVTKGKPGQKPKTVKRKKQSNKKQKMMDGEEENMKMDNEDNE